MLTTCEDQINLFWEKHSLLVKCWYGNVFSFLRHKIPVGQLSNIDIIFMFLHMISMISYTWYQWYHTWPNWAGRALERAKSACCFFYLSWTYFTVTSTTSPSSFYHHRCHQQAPPSYCHRLLLHQLPPLFLRPGSYPVEIDGSCPYYSWPILWEGCGEIILVT